MKLSKGFAGLSMALLVATLSACGSLAVDEGVQEALDSWEEVSIPGGGSIQMPPSMEVQSEAYRDAAGTSFVSDGGDRLVLQQKGQNEDPGNEDYARVIVEDTGESPEERFGSADPFDPDMYTEDDLAQLDDALHEIADEGLRSNRVPMELLSWDGLEFCEIDGVDSMRLSYTRSVGGGEPARVWLMYIPDDGRVVSVTVSYRELAAARWKDDLKTAAATMRLD